MADYDFGELASPAKAAPSTPSRSYDFGGLATAAKPTEKEKPKSTQSTTGFVGSNLSAGVAGLLGMPVDTVANVLDLGKAGIGTAYQAVSGKPAPDWTLPTDRAKVPLSGANIAGMFEKAGAINKSITPESKGQEYLASALQAAPGALLGKPNPAQLAKNVVGSTASALSGKAASDILPSSPGAAELGSMLPGAARYGIPAVPRALVRGGEAGRQTMQDRIAMFKEAGIDNPTAGQASGRPMVQGVENISAMGPFAGSEAAAAKRAGGLQAKVKELSDQLAPRSTPESAGAAVQQGIAGQGGFIDRFKAKQADLWGRIDPYLQKDTPINVKNLRAISDKLSTPTKGAEATTRALINPKIANISAGVESDIAPKAPQGLGGKAIVLPNSVRDDLAQAATGTLPYSAVKDLRSRIGAMLSSTDLLSDIPKAELKQLYGALTQDLKTAVRNADSSGAATKAWNDANKYTKAGHQRVEEFLQGITDKITPEAAYKAVMSGSDQGSTKLRTVLKSLNSDQRKALSATVIDNMGKANPGKQNEAGDAFSIDSFLTRYNKLDKSSKAFLFSDSGAKASMEKIAKAAAELKASEGVNKNYSGTAQASIKGGALASVGGMLLAGNPLMAAQTASGIGLNAAFSRAMNNPKFVNWLAEPGTMNPAQNQQQLIRLIQASKNSTDQEKQDIQTIIDATNGAK